MSRVKTKREMVVVRLKRLVKRVLAQSPDDVRAFVIDHSLFIEFHAEAHALCLDSEGRWVIVLKIPYDPVEMPATVAHDIAHASLRHQREGRTIDREVEAAVLAQRWGFTGGGADPAYQRFVWRDQSNKQHRGPQLNDYVEGSRHAWRFRQGPAALSAARAALQAVPVDTSRMAVGAAPAFTAASARGGSGSGRRIVRR
jgi:hypothetical protein